MLPIAYTKSFEVKPQFDRHFDSKSYRILLNTTILLLRYFGDDVGAAAEPQGHDGAVRLREPGLPMATRVVTLLLASMLHAFEWRLPEGMQPADVDVTDRFGTSLSMVTPLKAVQALTLS